MSFEAATSVTASIAAFGIARGELVSMRAERAMITVLALCGLVLGLVLLATWIPYWLEWWRGTGTLPPLDLPLQPGPYRHYHIAAMLLALLLPASLQARVRRGIGPIAVLAAIAALGVVFMSGSRTAWLALLAVGLAAVVLRLRLRLSVVAGFAAIAGAVLAVLAFSGALATFTARLLNTYTLALRAETWSSALGIWLERPLTGWGPSSFAAVFRFNEDLPIYPDPGGHAHNLVVQVLLEAGAVGLVALVIGVFGLAIGIWRHPNRSSYAVAGIALFGLMSLVDLPGNFPMVLAVGICWAALAAPRASETQLAAAAHRNRAWTVPVSGALGAMIVAAVASSLLAWAAFDEARFRLGYGDLPAARRALDRAVALDPSMALYWRERGTRAAEAGDRRQAQSDLEHALRLNGGDATTLRVIATLAIDAGRPEDAIHVAQQAVEQRGTQLENQLTLAWAATQAGDGELANRALADALAWNPWVAAAPTWAETYALPTDTALRQAAASWAAEPDARQRSWEATWLRAMTGAEPLAGLSPTLAAIDATIRCDPPRAAELLAEAGTTANDFTGLVARLMLSSLTNDAEAFRAALDVSVLRRSEVAVLAGTDPGPASPVSDYEGDIGLYRRIPLPPAEVGSELPTRAEGFAAWLQNPFEAARRGAPESGLAQCAD
jgi:tetratricopeptide (TPR) repeat protein